MLKELLEYFEKIAKAAHWPDWVIDYVVLIITPILVGLVLFATVYKLLKLWWKYKNNKYLNKNVGLNYSRNDVFNATNIFIPTRYQETTPSDDDEPGQTVNSYKNLKLIKYFVNEVFNESKIASKYFMILADTGMGKTTFLINLMIKYKNRDVLPWALVHPIKLIALGSPNWISEVSNIENKENTILLLDALDEDEEAGRNYEKRKSELINTTKRFKTVIVTCRTQFFPSQIEEPKTTDDFSYGETGFHDFEVLYISPFNNKEAFSYIGYKYPVYKFWLLRKRFQAIKLFKGFRFLLMRPMLLSHIDDLIGLKAVYEYSYQLYSALIKKWIERESRKYGIIKKYGSKEKYEKLLNRFSQKLAYYLFINRDGRRGYSIFKDEPFEFEGFTLKDMEDDYLRFVDHEKKSKSLLNRTSDGFYKFSHRSIFEFFVAKELIEIGVYQEENKFVGNDAAKTFYFELLVEYFAKNVKGKYCLDNRTYFDLSFLKPSEIKKVSILIIHNIDTMNQDYLKIFNNLKMMYIINDKLSFIYNSYYWFLNKINKYESVGLKIFKIGNEADSVEMAVLGFKRKWNLNRYPMVLEWLDSFKEGSIILKAFEFENRRPDFSNYSQTLVKDIKEQRMKWDDRNMLLHNSDIDRNEEYGVYLNVTSQEELDEFSVFIENVKKLENEITAVKIVF